MLGHIQSRDRELVQTQGALEQRVTERTRELATELAERRRAELQLAERNRQLAASNRELDDFAYVASHDLKEPLRGIHNYAGFLLEDYSDRLDDEGRSKLQTLMRLTRRMESLIESLLHYSRVGRVELATGDVDLQRVVEELVESLAITLAESGAEIIVADRLPVVRCDRVRVEEVFRNLVINAIKYNSGSEKRVEIGVVPPGGEAGGVAVSADGPAVLFVRDNGIGIPARHHQVIFEIFKRLHGREAYGGGTGSGLTIVKTVIERHGGRIWVDSRPGEGATFYFTLEGGRGPRDA
jgi:light-regulated signal transduction histidine kinase (bacteriophytochrome)